MTRRALLIINGRSRQGSVDLSPALEVFGRGALKVRTEIADCPARVDAVIREHRDEIDCVVMAGGDGTLQCAAAALFELGLPLGILPLGTANDLARTLGIPLDLAAAAERIVEGRMRKIDLGSANDTFFFNVAHIGLGARVRATLSPELKQQWGSLSYVRALIETMTDRRPFRASLEFDGRVERIRSIQVAVGNGRYYGGGMTVSQDATIDDSCFHVYSIAPFGFWRLFRMAFALSRGIIKDPEAVRVLQASQLTIRTDRPMKVAADGELITSTPVHFNVFPKAIAVYAASETTL